MSPFDVLKHISRFADDPKMDELSEILEDTSRTAEEKYCKRQIIGVLYISELFDIINHSTFIHANDLASI